MSGAHFETGGGNTISFAHKLAGSPRFKTLFRDGMDLVEQVATYLDGPGREEAKILPRPVALAYAAESMRLTTRLMQLASWLLVQRAFNEGEMTAGDVERHKVRLCAQDVASGPGVFLLLPAQLQDLTERSLRLQARLLYLDRSIHAMAGKPNVAASDEVAPIGSAMPSELGAQWEKLRMAFHARP